VRGLPRGWCVRSRCGCFAAVASIVAPARHDSSLFQVVVQFNQDVPGFSQDFVKVFCGSEYRAAGCLVRRGVTCVAVVCAQGRQRAHADAHTRGSMLVPARAPLLSPVSAACASPSKDSHPHSCFTLSPYVWFTDYVYGVQRGSFQRISQQSYTRFAMNVWGFVWGEDVIVTTEVVRVPSNASSPQAINSSRTIPFAAWFSTCREIGWY
jgi:hypothetical protein